MITVTAPDGTTVQFPDDTPMETIRQVMADNFPPPEAPTQRLRALGQGLTFGFADELAAMAQAPLSFAGISDSGAAYERALQGEREPMAQYRKDYPYSSLGWEMGGAMLPALVTGGASAAPSAARTASVLGSGLRAATAGAVGGAAYGYGTGEGGVAQRLAGAGAGAIGGGAIGGALGIAGGALAKYGIGKFINWVRSKVGDRMAGAVAAEVQRMAEQGGMTADEIIAGVASGRLMAENKTLNTMVRKFYSEGGPAGAEIKNVMGARPAETRTEAMSAMQGALTEPGNPLANRRASEQLTAEAERAAYGSAFGGMPSVPTDVLEILTAVANNAPEALKDAAKAARLKEGVTPFFREVDGRIEFTRQPSLEEAESVYRALRDQAGAAYREGRGSVGEGYKALGERLKGQLDVASPDLAAARADAATVRNARDAFVLGQQATTKTPDELALIVADIEKLGPDAVKAFRDGLATAIRGRMASPSAAPGTMRSLANEETGPGTALRMALPPGAADAVLGKVRTAEEAQAASSYVLGGSATAPTMAAPSIGGATNAAQDLASGMGGDLMAWARLVGGLAGDMQPRLTDAQRLEVARIVLSKDPALVERALKDNSLVGRLQTVTAQAIKQVIGAGVRGAAPVTPAYIDNMKAQ